MYLQGPYNYQALKSADPGPHWAMMMSICLKRNQKKTPPWSQVLCSNSII